ncbi:vitamin K epoxide reductase family protein [Gordonia sp. (in: high G+C Gram-positive bacteria)]|uniref:vitamin K epoxide reductase family protein n=1 Tax=Gordonia sp. (in: high G+C Gram-positive bacteria) TaxID=84139 RepID=UPI002FDA274C
MTDVADSPEVDQPEPESHAADESAGFDVAALRAQAEASWTRIVAWVLTIGGAIGLIASADLSIEKIEMLKDPSYSPSCNFNSLFSCGSVMVTDQASAFGPPNPFIGIAGFSVFVTVGVALLSGARLAKWFWLGLQLGATFAVVFVHWLIDQSLYEIGKLCPWCMVVWSVTIPSFLFVTVRNAHAFGLVERSRFVGILARNHGLILMVWVLTLIALIVIRFWDEYFSTLY